MSVCLGRNLDDHCCYLQGVVCEFLEENSESGFRWSCGLRRELESWEAVLEDNRYQPIKQHFEKNGYNCATYPSKGILCNTCGARGD